MQLVWFGWTLAFLAAWSVVYISLPGKGSKREMLVVSLWTSLLGLTEPLFVPEYWNPPSLFDLAKTTGFDIESLIFCFAVGGLAVVLYERIFPVRHVKMTPEEIAEPRHRFHPLAILATPALFIVLALLTGLNPIYCGIVSLFFGGFLTWYCRPDLKVKMAASGLLFLGFYFVFFLLLIFSVPGYVQAVWNLPELSGIMIAGIPVEELLFAFSFGFFWSSIYEHLAWRKLERVSVR